MTERSKLLWHCRRGIKELDMLLLSYLERRYDVASLEEQRLFAELLELQDPQLFAYLIGRETPADAALTPIIQHISAGLKA